MIFLVSSVLNLVSMLMTRLFAHFLISKSDRFVKVKIGRSNFGINPIVEKIDFPLWITRDAVLISCGVFILTQIPNCGNEKPKRLKTGRRKGFAEARMDVICRHKIADMRLASIKKKICIQRSVTSVVWLSRKSEWGMFYLATWSIRFKISCALFIRIKTIEISELICIWINYFLLTPCSFGVYAIRSKVV